MLSCIAQVESILFLPAITICTICTICVLYLIEPLGKTLTSNHGYDTLNLTMGIVSWYGKY